MTRKGLILPSLAFVASLAFGQTGTVKSDGQPLPGATVRATQGSLTLTTLTSADGSFALDKMTPGAWTVEVSMFGFEPARREVQVGVAATRIDFTLQLRAMPGPFPRGGPPGRGDGQQIPEAGVDQPGADGALVANAAQEPPGGGVTPVNAAGANESFLVSGSLSSGIQTQPGDFAPGFGPGGFGPGGFGGAGFGGPQGLPGQGGPPPVPTAAAPSGAAAGGPQVGPGGGPGGGFGGGRGGFGSGGFGRGPGGFGGPGGRQPGGRGGPPPVFIGNRRNVQQARIRSSFYYSARNSVVDAAPYSLNGQPNTKAAYAENRFGFNLAGPLGIPKWFRWERTTVLLGYNGNLTRNGVNLTGTVPTLAEREGNFSSSTAVIYDPATRLPFPGNRITQIDPIALGLLQYIPKPNQPGLVNNYRLVTANPADTHAANLRVLQSLSGRDQLVGNINWQRRNFSNAQMFGFVDDSFSSFWNGGGNWRHNFGAGLLNNIGVQFNRSTNQATPFFAFGPDVAAALGIQGTSSDAVNFGPPNVNFTNFAPLTDGSPSRNLTYSYGVTDALAWRRGKHNWSFGGGYTRNFNDTVTDQNGRGTFTFTGLATSALDAQGRAVPDTGSDLADFLIGAPQSNSIRYGSSTTNFRTYSWYGFAQDDWRVLPNLSLNLGLRYEYFAPWEEKYNRIANLDVAPGFSAVSVVTPGVTGPYSGAFPRGLINPDRNNFGPRTAMAWKPWAARSFTVRLGYGMYYNPAIYNQFTTRLAQQPPFAQSTTVNTSLTNPLTLATGLTVTPNGKTILNTFAVDRNYRSMYAQTWSAGVQASLPAALVLELNYLGTKGTRLDIQQSPNQAAPGSQLTAQDRLTINNATAFLYNTPVGNSIYHAAQVRVNRRFRNGFSSNVQYTFAKSIDNSSTLGGAGNTVAQNFLNLAAERGLSSFDRRHALTANYVWIPPIGDGKLLSGMPVLEPMFRDWTFSGSATVQTGNPLTARVLGNQSDTAGVGTLGSSRAQATGQSIYSDTGFFNLAAFATPPAGRFGNAGRNTIPGPGSFFMNLSVQRLVPLGERVRVQIRVDANNVTNHVNVTGFGTVVNARNYGAITGAGGMRNLTLTMRFNF